MSSGRHRTGPGELAPDASLGPPADPPGRNGAAGAAGTTSPCAPRAPRTAGIVLAGGLSRRFGSNKLAAPFGGGTVLDAAVRAVADVVDEVLVAIGPEADPPPLPADLSVPVAIVRDQEEGGGPLAALRHSLEKTAAPVVLVVAGDTPHLPRGVAHALLDALAGPGPARPGLAVGGGRDRSRMATAALLVRGSFQQLPFALRREAGLGAVIRLLADGERRLLPLFVDLGAAGVPEASWRRDDPDGLVLRDVDVPGDLDALG